MSAQHAAQSVVAGQQDYARGAALAKLFEDLQVAIIYARPADAAAFVSAEAARMAAAAAAGGAPYRAAPAGAAVDSEEGAAAYMEAQRVRPLLEELFAALLVAKPADPLAFVQEEALKLQALRAGGKAVSARRGGAARASARSARARARRRSRFPPPPPSRPPVGPIFRR